MKKKDAKIGDVVTELNASDCLHGAGFELMMMVEELDACPYPVAALDVAKTRDRLWLITQVVGSVIFAHEAKLEKMVVKLPSTVAAKKIYNPYYEGGSEEASSDDKASTTGTGDDFPF